MIVVTTNDLINENPCVGSMSVFFRVLPLLKRNKLLTLQTIKQNNSNTHQKEPTLL